MKKILLVNPHDTAQTGFTNPPLGLLYLAGTLLTHNFNVRVVDGCLDGKDAIELAIKEYQPHIVGITCLTPGRKKVLKIAEYCKAVAPKTTVVIGGVHPTIMYKQLLENYSCIDYIILGEGEQTLLELAKGFEPHEIDGLAFVRDGRVVKTSTRQLADNLDEIPFPAWHLIDLHRYPPIGDQIFRGIDLRREPRVSVIFSRGCTGHCDFCSTWWIWRGWRRRSAKNMVDELELLYKDHNIRHFCFADDALTVDREATINLCDEIISRGLNIAFHVTTRSDCVDEIMLSKLSAAGCYNIAYGIETGSPQLLAKMNKQNDILFNERAIHLTKQAGILTTALIIVGSVGETTETIKETVEFLNRTKPDIVGCAGALWVFPGTKLYQICKKKGFIDDSYWLGDEPYKIYDLEWKQSALREMEQIIYNHDKYVTGIDKVSESKESIESSSLLTKWRRYVNTEVNEYSSTTEWIDAQVQHKELMEFIPASCETILDLGCGDGWSTNYLKEKGKRVTGVTINPLEAAHARKKYGLDLVVRDMHDLSFDDKSFDCIYCRENYEHSVAPYIALCEMNRVLKLGGYALINLPWEEWIREDSHFSVFNPPQMREMFYKCRFVIEREGRTAHGHFWYLARKIAEIGEPHPYSPPIPGKLWLNGKTVESENATIERSNPAPTKIPRIICQMRIKNEEKWLKEVLDSIARIAHGIVVFDDGSTDSTPDICREHPSVLDYHRQKSAELDEVRDKNILLKMALKHDPDWILCMDGDEIFEESAPERIFDAIRSCPADVTVLDLEFLYMWDDLYHYRTDGIYRRIFHHRLFSLAGQDRDALSFVPTGHGGNFHCESVPPNIRGKSMEIDVKIKHLGYMFRADRERKFHWYMSNDPGHAAMGYYNHLLDQPGMTIEEWRERPFMNDAVKSRATGIAAGGKQELKPAYYYANVRRNIISLVPTTARRILDVGCGQGLTGGALRSERGIEVVGVELHPEVAVTAGEHLNEVLVGDLETMEIPYPDGYFDCILLLDVLEHLNDPWNAITRLVRYLDPDGVIIASIPNVRNLAVIRRILDGSFAYEEQGILDRTHLRFFALADMNALFTKAGLRATVAEVVPDPLFEKSLPTFKDFPADITAGNMMLRGVSAADLKELTAQQFILTATRAEAQLRPTMAGQTAASAPTVSVIIPVYNNVAFTRQCIESIFRVREQARFEVIVVDDASTDGTREYLSSLGAKVRTVSNPSNLGFAASCNAGARAATGRHLLFLNNDTIVFDSWITGMLDCMAENPDIGLVGNLQIYPDTGLVQHAGIVCNEDRMLYSIYNQQLRFDHPAVNRAREFQFVAGSCMLLERDLYFSVGGFDTAYLNSCEDVDLCMKIRAAGRKVWYTPKSSILHFESRTVTGHSKEGGNYRLFLERWGDKLLPDDTSYLDTDGMRAPARPTREERRSSVVLIAPPRYFKFPGVSGYSGYSKNLGLGYVAAALRQGGIDVSIIDAFALGIDRFEPVDRPNGRVYRCGLPYREIAQAIPADCDFIGISIPFTNVATIAFELAEYLKERFPSAKIVLGGVHPSTFPAESLRQGVDFVIAGEGEESMLALVRDEAPETIPGLSWRDGGGKIRLAEKAACVTNLDSIPFPAWDLLPMERYLTLSPRGNRTHRSLSIITSRGCPFSCTFCSIHPVAGRNWRARTPANVLAEIRAARERYGINHLEIEDDNFTLDRNRALEILRGIREIGPDMTWSAHNGVRIDTLDEELLTAIRDSGCIQLNLAIEHGDPAVLSAMDKKLSLTRVREVVAICGRLGIPTMGFCLVGFPGENADAFRNSFRFYQDLRRLGLGMVSPFIVNAYPGTELYRQAETNGWLTPGTREQLFFLEDEFVSVTTPDFDHQTVMLRKRVMELLNTHPEINAELVCAQIPEPACPTVFMKRAGA